MYLIFGFVFLFLLHHNSELVLLHLKDKTIQLKSQNHIKKLLSFNAVLDRQRRTKSFHHHGNNKYVVTDAFW